MLRYCIKILPPDLVTGRSDGGWPQLSVEKKVSFILHQIHIILELTTQLNSRINNMFVGGGCAFY
jgi:hypothetical protein